MAPTLLDDVTGFMASRSLSDAATKLNEPEGAIFRGYQAASAAVLGALAGKAGDSNFMSQAFDLIKSTFSGGKIATPRVMEISSPSPTTLPKRAA